MTNCCCQHFTNYYIMNVINNSVLPEINSYTCKEWINWIISLMKPLYCVLWCMFVESVLQKQKYIHMYTYASVISICGWKLGLVVLSISITVLEAITAPNPCFWVSQIHSPYIHKETWVIFSFTLANENIDNIKNSQ